MQREGFPDPWQRRYEGREMQITAPHTVSAAPKITSIKRYSIIASSMETKELKQSR